MAMDNQLKQRIVGAVVLVTLGVIFIPALLDGSGYRSRQIQEIEIRDKPEFPPLSQTNLKPIPTPVETNRGDTAGNDSAADDKAPGKAPVKASGASGPAAQAGKQAPIQSFALQVGTFENEPNAVKLRDKLRKAGYSTYVQVAESDGKTSYKVRVGPNLERAQLENSKKQLAEKFRLDGYIVNHP